MMKLKVLLSYLIIIICVAHTVVKYTGGKVLQYEKRQDFNLLNKELEYNKENILNPYFIIY